jgi:hypothetical protein
MASSFGVACLSLSLLALLKDTKSIWIEAFIINDDLWMVINMVFQNRLDYGDILIHPENHIVIGHEDSFSSVRAASTSHANHTRPALGRLTVD